MTPYAVPPAGRVDRAALLARHSPRVTAIDPRSPLQVGNGNFAFTADVTGLQTFPDAYPVRDGDGHGTVPGRVIGTLLGTMSSWGWHSVPFDSLPGVAAGTPAPPIDVALRDYEVRLDGAPVPDRDPVPYVDLRQEQWGGVTGEPDLREEWLRNNPHRLDLGRVSLWLQGGLTADDVERPDQHLDLATGVLTSRFTVRGLRYEVTTAVHPERDELAVEVRRLGVDGEADVVPGELPPDPFEHLGVEIAFPYGSQSWGNAQDWTRPEAHTTTVHLTLDGDEYVVDRALDDTRYGVTIRTAGATLGLSSEHRLRFVAEPGTDALSVLCHFTPSPIPGVPHHPSARMSDVVAACSRWWEGFWSDGAAVSFEGTADPRAAELERRVVLSQYLTAVNCAGSTPPAETGLMLNSWRGKFHLEMHWWHAAHFPAWGRPELLERSLGWYASILDRAQATAARQGYAGARWPKQTDPSGTETPSSIGTFLVWQQPHPIYLAELVRRATPSSCAERAQRVEAQDLPTAGLDRYAAVVRATADFMASFPVLGDDGAYHLPGPLVPAQESYARDRANTQDPTFELAYWAWGLRTAADWVERLGEPAPPAWRKVADALHRPQPVDGVYPAIGVEPWTIRTDHPSMVAALGVVPDTGMIDRDVMAATLDDVVGTGVGDDASWDWASTWGWDYPVGAMTAARLDRPEVAVDWLLLGKGKNEHLPNGHNYQTPALPIYLPGNGGLLTAVALMAGGWDGAPDRPAPGFPASWKVAHEGFVRMP